MAYRMIVLKIKIVQCLCLIISISSNIYFSLWQISSHFIAFRNIKLHLITVMYHSLPVLVLFSNPNVVPIQPLGVSPFAATIVIFHF